MYFSSGSQPPTKTFLGRGAFRGPMNIRKPRMYGNQDPTAPFQAIRDRMQAQEEDFDQSMARSNNQFGALSHQMAQLGQNPSRNHMFQPARHNPADDPHLSAGGSDGGTANGRQTGSINAVPARLGPTPNHNTNPRRPAAASQNPHLDAIMNQQERFRKNDIYESDGKGLFGKGIFTRRNAAILGAGLRDAGNLGLGRDSNHLGGYAAAKDDYFDSKDAFAQNQNRNALGAELAASTGDPNQSLLQRLDPNGYAGVYSDNYVHNPLDIENGVTGRMRALTGQENAATGRYDSVTSRMRANTGDGRLKHDQNVFGSELPLKALDSQTKARNADINANEGALNALRLRLNQQNEGLGFEGADGLAMRDISTRLNNLGTGGGIDSILRKIGQSTNANSQQSGGQSIPRATNAQGQTMEYRNGQWQLVK